VLRFQLMHSPADANDGHDSAANVSRPTPPARPAWGIGYVKRKIHEHKVKYKDETPADRSARRTATATVWIAIFTLILVLVTVRTLLDSMSSFDAQQRPYLVAAIGFQGPQYFPSRNGKVRINVQFTNIGKTPATEVRNYGCLTVLPLLKSPSDTKRQLDNLFKSATAASTAKTDETNEELDLAPSVPGSFSTYFLTDDTCVKPLPENENPMSPEAYDSILKKTHILYMIGGVRYSDASGAKYETKTCQAWADPSESVRNCLTNNTIR